MRLAESDAPVAASGPGTLPAAGASRAPLEQLRCSLRELEGGVVAVHAGASCWLFDCAHSRYVRAQPNADPRALMLFAHWEPMTDLRVDDGDLVVVGARGATVRIHIDPAAIDAAAIDPAAIDPAAIDPAATGIAPAEPEVVPAS